MKNLLRCFLIFVMSLFFIATFAANSATSEPKAPTLNTKDPRTKMPAIFADSWIGLSIGYKKTNFSNSDFPPLYAPQSFKDGITALRATIGHYFSPYFAISLNLLRGAHSNKLYYPDAVYSVPESLFAFTLRPTLPLNDELALFGEAGVGFISRRGYQRDDVQAISNADIFSPVLGAGLYINLPDNLFLDLEAEYTPKNPSHKQPSILYLGMGVNYLLKDTHSQQEHSDQYWFPVHTLQLDYVNGNIFYADAAKYFTTPRSIPVFFDGSIKINKGIALMYQNTFFHTYKNFSIEWGWSLSEWESRMLKQKFYTISLFPEIKVWIVRLPSFDFYFTYSLAGPTYISKVYIDHLNSGSNFTFQDFLGFGAFLGHSKRVALNVKIVHYSNGNSLPNNPGVCVPVMAGLVVSF